MARSSVGPAARGPRHKAAAHVSPPTVCLLSNGRYTVMLTQAGSGYSTCEGLDVTRWREDATSDCWGQYFYHIVVENRAGTGRGVRAVTRDAQAVRDGEIPLMDDGKTHTVRVELG